MKQGLHAVLYVNHKVEDLDAFMQAFGEHFRVLTATSAVEALNFLESAPVGILLTHQRLPDTPGNELCRKVRVRFPDVVRMVITAYSDVATVVTAVNQDDVNRYFVKPWRDDELIEALDSALELFHLVRLTKDIQTRLLHHEQHATETLLAEEVVREIGPPAAAILSNLSFLADSISQLGALAKGANPDIARLSGQLTPAIEDARRSAETLMNRLELLQHGEIDLARLVRRRRPT